VECTTARRYSVIRLRDGARALVMVYRVALPSVKVGSVQRCEDLLSNVEGAHPHDPPGDAPAVAGGVKLLDDFGDGADEHVGNGEHIVHGEVGFRGERSCSLMTVVGEFHVLDQGFQRRG